MAIKQDEIKVVVGAGVFNNNPGWVQTQEDELNLLDNTTWEERFEYNSISAILAEHVWEHLTFEEGVKAAEICYKFLKPAGHIRCGVPDAFFRDEAYQNIVQIGGPGPKDHPAANHKIVHNYKTLTKMFEIAGFEVVLLEYCDENGQFYYNEWDANDGVIFRSKKYDSRNRGDKLGFPSLIVDAIKR
ncbi:SAM-dependent methyltransferase [Bacillus cereus]|nr:SAM-dependent methyltransferase [Bacillus cereus]PFH83149.1 SAM-dependent methyltransferase [Bacillus cereus]PFM52577.1 SAM-dependent methyltransferase [Bacillus cereus]PFS08946.1 SAM-dependent methyltransferase [Bacillus cereus]PGS27072.1 SAM-dependent methyltransferase [Bacillus cereus]